jgi:glyoxylase-like metal-dependent hydrolase (beta-lactamase superfamily II)
LFLVVQLNNYEDGKILEWKWASDNELIPSPFFTSCYFIDGILIDSGAPASENDLMTFIKSLFEQQRIIKCIITHSHEDHSGGAHLLNSEFNIPIYAHKKAISILKKESHYPQYRQLAWGEKRKRVFAKEVPKRLKTSNHKFTFDIFPMPGHAPELIALVEKSQQWAFVSDAIQPRYKMLFGHDSDIQENISEIVKSMKNLLEYTKHFSDLKVFISGHGIYGREIIKQKIEEIQALHVRVHDLYIKFSKEQYNQPKILKKILKEIFGRETAIGKLTNGDLSIMNLIKSLHKWPLKT